MRAIELFKSNNSIVIGDSKAIELVTFLSVQLSTPDVLIDSKGLATWDIVDHALSYNIRINGGDIQNIANTQYQLDVSQFIQVQAVGDGLTYLDSEWSDIWTYYGNYSEGLSYISNGDGTCSITGIGVCGDLDIRIPPVIDGLKVVSISDFAFSGNNSITSLTTFDNVKVIGKYSFRKCSKLAGVIISSSVASIDEEAFYSCSNLKRVILSEGVKTIGNGAFERTGLTTLQIPGTAIVGSYSFMDCVNLTTVLLSDGVESIRRNAFQGCTSLTDVTIPNSVVSIGDAAFYGCSRLESLSFPNDSVDLGNTVFSECTNLLSISIPGNSGSLGDRMFRNCSHLSTVTIPYSLTYIGAYAFYGCTNLTRISYTTGSASDWGNIIFGKEWDRDTGDYTILCNDGPISKERG